LNGFGSVGISYRRASADIRDRVTLAPEAAAAFLDRLAARGVVQAMALSTCNRCEIFYWGSDAATATCRGLFQETFPEVRLADVLQQREGRSALTYLFSVAAGLESMILGEYQILGQVKDASAAAQASGHVGKELDRILREAITCAKRVKTDLDIGAVPPSVCQAGMERVEAAVGLAGRRVFVIGSGKTGSLAARFAHARGAREIAVCNRSPERTRKLVVEVGAKAVDYAARYETIAASDVVISATSSPHVVVRAERVRLHHPVFFLDLASPRDIEPTVAGNPLATLMSIDTIGELAEGDRAERERLTARGRELINQSVEALLSWLRTSRP